ncbi:DUF3806 domain-containing protein [Prosthecobacter sp.]|uniref:DUF3806 domain-containing protein n=1 Tax=Prosthecobacter sp. TaxID=1965333 RepID=UPI002ABD0FFD|nr:DUF3806 domain-containing protein [Prosthecobacter sp.]MDZ4404753.1 DUF3806 domain-containing protein [Prosthecobacter sp.]
MKHFAIGDGHKRITTPDRYRADRESDQTTVLWDPEHVDIVIRVSVITVAPKDKAEEDLAFWRTIKKAQVNNSKPKADGKKAIYAYREASSAANDFLHFYEVGLGNHFCVFSITVAESEEHSPAFAEARADLEDMIHTLVERGEGEQFTCGLLECEFERIDESVSSLLPTGLDDSSWTALQKEFDRAFDDRNEELAGRVGLVFGEMMRSEIPSLSWSAKIDADGSARALDLAESGISIFPEDMILKRFDRNERLDLRQFLSDTVDTMERIFREHQEER